MYPSIKYSERMYKSVAAQSVELSTGITPANGEEIAVYRFRANGSEPTCYVSLVWDKGGTEETYIASTKGDIDYVYESDNLLNHFTGDGSKKLQIQIDNTNETASPVVGGFVECVEILG